MTTLSLRISACLAAGLLGAPGVPAAGAAAQSVPVARADGAGAYDIWSAPANGGPAPLALDGVRFLPIRLAGATWRDRLRSDLPIEAGATSPAPHIRLPGGGSLFLAELPGATALLHVRADGTLIVACAVPAGPGGGALLPSVAVRADGLAALVAQPAADGGDVLLIDLLNDITSGAAPQVLTAALPPLAITAASLRLSDTRAFFVADAGAGSQLQRVVLGGLPAPQAAPVALGLAAGSTLLPETVLSGDGRSLLLIGQTAATLRHVVAVRPDGSAQTLTPAPAAVDAPALANPVGPFLALSPDGTLAAWRATVAGSKELFLQPVPQPVPLPPPPAQLTADNFFIDTLDNAGILGFTTAGLPKLTFVAGEAEGDGTLDAADLFTASFSAGGAPLLQNATQTSGLSVPPFVIPGELEIRAVVLDPRGERLLFTIDPQGGDAALLATAADGSGQGTLLLPPLAIDPVLDRAGDSVLVQSVSDAAPQAGTALHLLRPLGTPGPVMQLLGHAPTGLKLDRVTDGAAGTRLGLVLHAGPVAPAVQLPVRIDIATGAVLPAWAELYQVSPLIAVTPAGALAAGVGDPGGPYLFAAFTGFSTGAVLKVPVGFGFPLPH